MNACLLEAVNYKRKKHVTYLEIPSGLNNRCWFCNHDSYGVSFILYASSATWLAENVPIYTSCPSIHIPAYYVLVMIQTLWYSPWFVKTCNSFVVSIYLHKLFLPIPTTCNNAICNVKSVWFMSFSKVLTQDDLRSSLHISCVTSRGRCKVCHMRKLLTNYWIADLIIYPLSE